MIKHTEDKQDRKKRESDSAPFESADPALQPTSPMSKFDSDEQTVRLPVYHPLEQEEVKGRHLQTSFNQKKTPLNSSEVVEPRSFWQGEKNQFDYDWSVALVPTLVMPVPSGMGDTSLASTLIMSVPVSAVGNRSKNDEAPLQGSNNNVETLRKLLKSSGIYAIASVVTPLITLALSPFLARHLSPTEYGAFTILNNFVSLMAGITQLGLGSAFFRAYSYDYQTKKDKRDVLATITSLLCIVSVATVILMFLTASWLSLFLFGRASFTNFILLGAMIVLLQNLTVPGFAWLRAENKPLAYSLLSIGNLFVSLVTNLVLIGVFSFGLTGAVLGIGSGYAFVALCILPVVLVHAGIKMRPDIARNLLSFGVPMVLGVVSYWALQVLDRYLLNIFGSLAQTSEYAVAYSLGSAISIVVISPFTLAWASAMFTIAKREDAAAVFQRVFRLLCFVLLFAAFGLSLIGKMLLFWLFPPVYHAAAFVIPIVSVSLTFYGLYYVVNVGLNIKRKTWIVSTFSTVAALCNLAFNLVLIPKYGAMGAAVATLLAYIVLLLVAYVVNQRIYPLPLEMSKFALAFLFGAALYWGSDVFTQQYTNSVKVFVSVCTFLLYGIILALMELLPAWRKQELAKKYRRIS